MVDNLSQQSAESIVIKIKKLMALSKSSNEHEAALAASKAQELLLRYNVEMSTVDNVNLNSEDTRLVSEFHELFPLNVIQWKRDLAFAVAKANLCIGVFSGNGMYFLGKKVNIDISRYLFDTIVSDIERIAEDRWKQLTQLRKLQKEFPQINVFSESSLKYVHAKTWKASFYVGAIEVIKVRLQENLTELQVNNDNMMALVTTEQQRLKSFFKETFPRTTTCSPATASYRAAYHSGRVAGKDIQFKRGVGSGGSYSGPIYISSGNKE